MREFNLPKWTICVHSKEKKAIFKSAQVKKEGIAGRLLRSNDHPCVKYAYIFTKF